MELPHAVVDFTGRAPAFHRDAMEFPPGAGRSPGAVLTLPGAVPGDDALPPGVQG